MLAKDEISYFHKELNAWFKTEARELPWRKDKSLYKSLLSEFMLQQTRVDTVIPYFERWLKKFPTIDSLAQGSEEDVLHLWEGLGYYNRARNLHKLAKKYISLDTKPISSKQWQEMPGIGPYTAAAISSMVYKEANAVVDGNVVRVLCRILKISTKFSSNAEAVKSLTPAANKLLNKREPHIHNEAIMELGATVCHKAEPKCDICPLFTICKAASNKKAKDYPIIQRKAQVKKEINRIFLVENRKILLHKKPENSKRLAKISELPELNTAEIQSFKKIKSANRSITHYKITEHIYSARSSELKEFPKDCYWVELDLIDTITLSGPHRKWINDLLKKQKS